MVIRDTRPYFKPYKLSFYQCRELVIQKDGTHTWAQLLNDEDYPTAWGFETEREAWEAIDKIIAREADCYTAQGHDEGYEDFHSDG